MKITPREVEEHKKQIKIAIAQCDRYIAKEQPRSADLRPADIQKLLDWYIAHRAKLQHALDTDNVSEVFG